MPFEKDLGYLAQFLDKLETHAASLPADAQADLKSFVTAERSRWKTVTDTVLSENAVKPSLTRADAPAETEGGDMQLLENPSAPENSARSTRDEDPARIPAAPRTANAQPAPPPPRNTRGSRLTVGSLIRT